MSTNLLEYWNQRAIEHRGHARATTDDIHLRRLEERAIARTMEERHPARNGRVLDVGCGDGRTTSALARRFDDLHFTGVDFSEAMVQTANENRLAQPDLAKRVEFVVGDAGALSAAPLRPPYDIAISVRCLINLTSTDAQGEAMQQIARMLAPAGHYIAIENFIETHETMNAARSAVGLPAIPVRWHNRYFSQAPFLDLARHHFDLVRFEDFASAYYYATRVVYAKMCQVRGESPDYDHDIHRLAVDLSPHGQFSPVRLALLRRK